MAEAQGNRTPPGRLSAPLDGFEDRAIHQDRRASGATVAAGPEDVTADDVAEVFGLRYERTMNTLGIIILVLHIVSATLWIGPTLGLMKSTGRALRTSREALGLAVEDFKRRGMLATIGGTGIIATGLALIFIAGGFKVVPPPIHIALGLGILAAVQSAVFGAGGRVLAKAAETYDAPSIAAAEKSLKSMSIHAHISHGLWLASLIMMFWARVYTRA